ncbi:MAG: metalloregulator ArsR/SmtB family transcription factor [Candidatus Altiarchaeia archaeon]
MIKSCDESKTFDAGDLIPADEDIAAYSKMFQAASDPTRLKILFLLRKKELCVCKIVSAIGKKQAVVSHHLSVLQNAGLLKSRKDGKWTYYKTDNPLVLKIVKNRKKKGK